jgi:hypothetical protein
MRNKVIINVGIITMNFLFILKFFFFKEELTQLSSFFSSNKLFSVLLLFEDKNNINIRNKNILS